MGVGLFFGVLLGIFLTMMLGTRDTSETFDEFEARTNKGRTRPSSEHEGGGGGGGGGGGPHGGRRDPRISMAKVHFMKKFVKALTDVPGNTHPAADWEAILKDGAQPISCKDCHKDPSLDIEAMAQSDPGNTRFVQQLRRSPRFMIPLMEKWVERLNGWYGDRLKKPVTCTTCHAVDPKEKYSVYIPLMNSFVMALKAKPTNKNPATRWKPLLKDPGSGMLCGYCHGDMGKQMAQEMPDLLKRFGEKALEKYADNQAFMVGMMETWMRKANVELKDVLVKPLACLDCHDQDPRR